MSRNQNGIQGQGTKSLNFGSVKMATIQVENIPRELKELPNWVLWKYSVRNGAKTKIPCSIDGFEADVTNPAAWGAFEDVLHAHLMNRGSDGIGFVFTRGSGIIGIDIDHVIADGVFDPAVKRYIESADSYTEFSPSMQGIHIFCMGIKPGARCRHGSYEMYDNARFFTVTGNRIPGAGKSVRNTQGLIDSIYNEQINQGAPDSGQGAIREKQRVYVGKVSVSACSKLSDSEIFKKCIEAKNSKKFLDLFNGKTGAYASASEAEFALCRIIAFYTQDFEQIARIVTKSGLSRTKWYNHPTYLIDTISRAAACGGAVYGQ